MNISTFDLEKELWGKGVGFVVGVDEAGRGPLAGPVVACAAVLRYSLPLEKGELERDLKNENNGEVAQNNKSLKSPQPPFPKGEKIQEGENDKMWDLVRDSKKLSAGQREKAFDFVLENFHIGIGICDHETIDRINILEASFLAMKKAVQELMRIKNQELRIKNDLPCHSRTFFCHSREGGNPGSEIGGIISHKDQNNIIILVDGNKKIPNFSGEQLAVVGGDKIVKSISAASIIAKVTRDRMMMEAHEKYPQYGFAKHKGYGTKIHMEALKNCGPCEIHRKSFAPVKKVLKNT